MKPLQTYHTAATTFRDKEGYNKGVCQAVRTSDRPANPNPLPMTPPAPLGCHPVEELESRLSSAGGNPALCSASWPP